LFESEGTVFGSINKKDFQELPIIKPINNVLKAFDEIVSVMDDRITINEEKLRTLTTLRDTLLPRLISGQLRINQAQDLINEVGA
jgi:type I restriction enzyme S subunit